jgi:hypothetical protein
MCQITILSTIYPPKEIMLKIVIWHIFFGDGGKVNNFLKSEIKPPLQYKTITNPVFDISSNSKWTLAPLAIFYNNHDTKVLFLVV